MGPEMNRLHLAGTMRKREQTAKDLMVALLAKGVDTYVDDLAADAVSHADALFDALETPRELRDHHDDFDHDGTP